MKPRRAAIYARVSTDGQTTDNQLLRLRDVAALAGWVVVEEYVETVSGASPARPGLERLMKDAARRRFDVVMAWSVDRLGRSLQGLVGFLSDLSALRVDLYLEQQAVDTTTPAGRAMFQMLGVFAEFERALIAERTRSGLDRARQRGARLGRPPIPDSIDTAIRALRARGLGMDAIAREMRCGKSVSQRVCQQFDAEQREAPP